MQSLTAAIEEQLVLQGIGDVLCVAQSYDGAAVMSSAVGKARLFYLQYIRSTIHTLSN